MIEVIAGEDFLVSGGSYKENGCGGLGEDLLVFLDASERKTRIIVEFDRRYIDEFF